MKPHGELNAILERILSSRQDLRRTARAWTQEVYSLRRQFNNPDESEDLAELIGATWLAKNANMLQAWAQDVREIGEQINILSKGEPDCLEKLNESIDQVDEYELLNKRNRVALLSFGESLDQAALLAPSAALLREILLRQPHAVDSNWELYTNPDNYKRDIFPDAITYATLIEHETPSIRLPQLLPFIGSNRATLFRCSPHEISSVHNCFQAIALRIAMLLPQNTRFTFIDPFGQGRSFSSLRSLPNELETYGNSAKDFLDSTVSEIDRFVQEHMHHSAPSFDNLPDSKRRKIGYQIIFLTGFPDEFDTAAHSLIYKIARNGPYAGIYMFIQENQQTTKDQPNTAFENIDLTIVDMAKICDQSRNNASIELLSPPPPQVQHAIVESLVGCKNQETELRAHELVLPRPERFTSSASRMMRAHIGQTLGGDPLKIWFGEDEHKRGCSHGIIAAMTGAGKSNLYHLIITSLATKYSPDEIALYLIDGKDGVEFRRYQKLPHAQIVSLNTQPGVSRAILKLLLEEKTKRNEAFGESNVVDLKAYRDSEQAFGIFPRCLLLIDEYQILFEDGAEEASYLLSLLAKQGRSAGIHMLLGSQRFAPTDMRRRKDILSNIQARIAMQMADSEISGSAELAAEGKRLLKKCNKKGRLVLNTMGGSDGANIEGQIPLLNFEESSSIVSEVIEDLSAKGFTRRPRVFDGKKQPQLASLLFHGRDQFEASYNRYSPPPTNRESIENGRHSGSPFKEAETARMPIGTEFEGLNVCELLLSRGVNENILVCGGDSSEQDLTAAAILSSFLMTPDTLGKSIHYWDRYQDESDPISRIRENLGPSDDVHCQRIHCMSTEEELEGLIRQALQEVEMRSNHQVTSNQLSQSVVYVIKYPERIKVLGKVQGKYGATESTFAKELKKLLNDGPQVGLHTLLVSKGVSQLARCFEKPTFEMFRHRIVLQTSEQDSYSLTGSKTASKLRLHGKRPLVAAYFDTEENSITKFKPIEKW